MAKSMSSRTVVRVPTLGAILKWITEQTMTGNAGESGLPAKKVTMNLLRSRAKISRVLVTTVGSRAGRATC